MSTIIRGLMISTDSASPSKPGSAGVPEAATPAEAKTSSHTGRRVLAAFFWLLASLSILLGGVTLWAHQTLLSSSGWGNLVGDVIDDPVVIEDISSSIVTRVSESLGVGDTVADVLPESLDIVAGALTSSVEDRITDLVIDFASSDGFEEAFVRVNEVGHDAALKAIRGGDSEAVTSEEGVIAINIFPIVEGVLLNLQDAGLIDESREIPDLTEYELPSRAVAALETLFDRDLPEDFGTIVLVDSENLGVVQEAVRYFDVITALFILLSILFVGLALWLSSSRVRMVLWLAGGAIAALAVGRVFVRLVLNRITDRAQEGDASATVVAIIDAAVNSLMLWTFALMAVAAVIALVAIWWERYRTGDRPAQESPPRTLGGWVRENMVAVLAVGLAMIAVVVLWNIGGADIALLTAAAIGLLLVAVKVLASDEDGAPAAAPEAPAPESPEG